MFEVFGKLGGTAPLSDPFCDHPFYRGRAFTSTEVTHAGLHLFGLSYDGRQQQAAIHDGDAHLIVVVGKIYERLDVGDGRGRELTARDVSAACRNGADIYRRAKGDFTLLIFEKASQELRIINDHFALRPFYYGALDGVFYFGNNLNHFKALSLPINQIAVLEKILFTYPLDDSTYFKGVSCLGCGEEIRTNGNTVHQTRWFDPAALVFNDQREPFSVDRFTQIFNRSVLQRADATPRIVASLTGGFDGRAVVSALLKHNRHFFSYSFGKKGGENTEIPARIAHRLGFEHNAIYLDQDFEEHFFDYACEALYFSDGMSFISRANYPYALSHVANRTNTVLTGLIAGEILRPIHLRTDYMNEAYYRLLYGDEPASVWHWLRECGYDRLVEADFVEQNLPRLRGRIEAKRQELQRYRSADDGFLFYLYDLIGLGFRRYYGTEMHLERQYVHNTSPFYDFDVLNYLLRTDYKFIFKNAFKGHPLFRWKGQQIYAEIYRRNCAALGQIPVDRGYRPDHLTSPLRRLAIPFLYHRRKKRLRRSPPEFTEEKWAALFYRRLDSTTLPNSPVFDGPALRAAVVGGQVGTYDEKFNRLFSLYCWLEMPTLNFSRPELQKANDEHDHLSCDELPA